MKLLDHDGLEDHASIRPEDYQTETGAWIVQYYGITFEVYVLGNGSARSVNLCCEQLVITRQVQAVGARIEMGRILICHRSTQVCRGAR